MHLIDFNTNNSGNIIHILLNNPWEFHSGNNLTEEQIIKRIDSGFYHSKDVKTFFLSELDEIIGFIRIFDLGEDRFDSETPLFDIRIKKDCRGKGLGSKAVTLAIEYVFTNYPNKNRFEATTRYDNIGMRKVLEKCGFVKEAHYRQSWPDKSNVLVDTVGYGILRSDWENKIKTAVNWNDM